MFSDYTLQRIRDIAFDILEFRAEMQNQDIRPGRREIVETYLAELEDELQKIFDNY